MKIKNLMRYILVVICYSGNAQIENDTVLYAVKGEFIEKFPNRITARGFYTETYNSYVFSSRNSNEKFFLEPNKQSRIGASVSYSFLSLSYSFAPDFMAENKDNSDSKLFNLHLRTVFGNWTQSIDIYNQKGFYAKSNGIYAPDINNLKIGGATTYIFNDRFSYRAISNRDEKQTKSAGSFIAGINYYYNRFNLYAKNENEKIDEYLFFVDVAITPGYHYNFVPISNLLLSAGGNVGIGLNYTWDDSESSSNLLTLWSMSGSATYDLENLFFGAEYIYLSQSHNSDGSTFTEDDISFFQIYVGYRFKAPKKWVHGTDKLMSKIKL